MPIKDPEKRRAAARAWYARTKHKRTTELVQRQTAVKRARRHEVIAWYAEMKGTLSCRRCGESHPACLQFHHSDPASKEMMLADAVRRGWSRQRILREAAKCEVLCANCHMKHHAHETDRHAREEE
jgi:hypothetical protein